MKKSSSQKYKYMIFSTAPYLGVLLGMYLFHNAFLAIFLYHLGILWPCWKERGNLVKPWTEKKGHYSWIILAMVVGAFAGPVILLLWNWMALPGLNLAQKLDFFALSSANRWIFLIYFCTIHPFLEEGYWRFSLPDKGRIIQLSDILFAGYHLLVLRFFLKPLWLPVALVVLITAASLWRWLIRKGQPRAAVLSHLIADLSILIAIFYISS